MALPWASTNLPAQDSADLQRYNDMAKTWGVGGSLNPAPTFGAFGIQSSNTPKLTAQQQKEQQDYINLGNSLKARGYYGKESGMFGGPLGKVENFVTDKVAPYLPAAGMAALSLGTGAFAGAGTAGADTAAASDAGMLAPASQSAVAADTTSPAWIAANSSQVPGIGSTITGVTPNMSTVPGITSEILGTGAPAASDALSLGTEAASTGASGLGGASGTVASNFGDAAGGITATGLGGTPGSSVVPAALNSTSGLPSSVIGTSAQLTPGQGPIGDIAADAGSTNTYDFDSINKALTQPTGQSTVASTMSKIAPIAKMAAKYGLPLAGLATQLLRKPGIPQEGNLNTQYNTQEAQGQADIAGARAGKISPSQQAQIDKFKSDSMSSLRQYMVNSGQGADEKGGGSTAFLEMKMKVDQAALAMQQGYVDQLFSQGMQELGLADSAQQQLINLRMQREQQTSDAMNNFMLSLGLMGAFA